MSTGHHATASTIVRPSAAIARSGIRALSIASPRLTARWAARRWTIIPRRAGRHGSRPPGGTPFRARFEGHRVQGRTWGDGRVVYLVHGWGGDAEQWTPLVPVLVRAGYRVVTFDAPSHGGSDPGPSGPDRSNGVEFGKALDAVAAVHGPAYAVVAHSLGALATMLTLRYGWLSAGRLVFLAPMSELRRPLDRYLLASGLGPRAQDRLVDLIEQDVGVAVDSVDLVSLASEAGAPPLLIVHDEDDLRACVDDSFVVAATWPGAARVLTTQGWGHSRLLAAPQVHDQVLRFLAGPDEQAHGTGGPGV